MGKSTETQHSPSIRSALSQLLEPALASRSQVTCPGRQGGGAEETGTSLVGKSRPQEMNIIWKIKQTQTL